MTLLTRAERAIRGLDPWDQCPVVYRMIDEAEHSKSATPAEIVAAKQFYIRLAGELYRSHAARPVGEARL